MIALALILTLAANVLTTTQVDSQSSNEVILRVAPIYPPLAQALSMNALCLAEFEIGSGGVPVDLCVRCSTSVPGTPSSYALDLAARQFVQAAEVSLIQWRYPEQYVGVHKSDIRLQFLMVGNTDDDLPDPPAMGECLGPQIS
ncbi:hypothetical protein [uncultured Maricaulis sp.]|uniref:hypothetical protein n=1 Tax=uncultured Maricaulis sp. TaxID=174710 RepID=UPI0030D79177|tara:strand:+ start:9158 stop:9586 length:429 start_codon:yes stop_codon:yes gene_type:complete